MYKIILIISCVFIGASCKQKRTFPDFTTITSRSIDAQPLSALDNTDWQLNDIFTDDENALFGNVNNNALSCAIVNADNFVCYPNDNSGYFNLSNSLDTNLQAEIVIVRADFSVIKRYNYKNKQNINFNIKDAVINNQYCRMYYKLKSSTCEYRGHGDIKIIK